jgi:CheY-like chemotaxis protein
MTDPKAEAKVVLVVDDDDPTRESLHEALTAAGYVVATAGDGREALAALRRHRPDAILLDLMMPDLDGWAVARQIREDPEFGATPIVVMTAYGQARLAAAPVAAGYLLKPMRLDDLLGVLRRTLELRASVVGDPRGTTSGVREIPSVLRSVRLAHAVGVEVEASEPGGVSSSPARSRCE